MYDVTFRTSSQLSVTVSFVTEVILMLFTLSGPEKSGIHFATFNASTAIIFNFTGIQLSI